MAYREHMRIKGCRPRTIGAAQSAIKQLMGGESRQLRAVTAAFLGQRVSVRRREGKSVDTVASELRNTRTFLRWCSDKGWVARSVVVRVTELKVEGKRRAGKPQLTLDESLRFVEKALSLGDEGATGSLCLLLLGLRLREVLDRRVRDLDEGGSVLWIREAKTPTGNRRVRVPKVLQRRLLDLADGKSSTDFLFAQPEGGPRSSTFLYKWVKRLCRKAGVTEVPPHGLRGTHATLAEDAGESSLAVAATLGHADTRVTGRHYTTREAREGARRSRFLEVLEGGAGSASTVGSEPLIQGEVR